MSSNNSNNQERVIEDGPQMRSVAIRSRAPMPIPLRSAIPAPVEKQMVSTRLGKTSQSTAWTVQSAPPLPSIYLLERTHAHINATAQQVASRVADCLYKQSIAVTFSTDETLATATTASQAQFCIRLWSADQGQTLVEIQRIEGCCRDFHLAAKAVLRAASGGDDNNRSESPKTVRRVPDAIRTEELEVTDECTKEGLEIAMDMIKQDRPDMVLLGMESLAQITSEPKCQVYSSNFILDGEIGSRLVSIVEAPLDESCMDHEVNEQKMMKYHSLTILRNTLSALEASGDIEETLSAHTEYTRSPFLMALVDFLHNLHCPHAACLATKILHVLIAAGPSCCKSRAANLNTAIDQALGSCRHAKLETECQQLRMKL